MEVSGKFLRFYSPKRASLLLEMVLFGSDEQTLVAIKEEDVKKVVKVLGQEIVYSFTANREMKRATV